MTDRPITRAAIEAALLAWYGRGDWKSVFFPADRYGGINHRGVEETMCAMKMAIEAADRLRVPVASDVDEGT